MLKPLVSICCMTYNHENYISQCLDGFVMQQTNFPIEILVHDDASTDNTAKIVKEYEIKFSGLFRCVYQTENQFAKQNTLVNIIFPMSRGKYIALCEGDDHWTDPCKLQKQVDFLEANDDFAICHHSVQIIYEKEPEKNKVSNLNQMEITDIYDLAKGNYIYTASCIFRNGLIKEFPEWFKDVPVGDYVLHMLNAQFGKIKFINETMGVYRIHQGSIWEHKSVVYRQIQWLTLLSLLEGKFEEKVNRVLIAQKKEINKSIVKSFELMKIENERTKQELKRIKGSLSYKIGCFIVKPFVRLSRMFNNA